MTQRLQPGDYLALVAGKLSATAIRASGAGLGSTLPGKVARTISPGILLRLSRQCRRGAVAITGTNGKSTTAGLLSSILRQSGLKVVHNRQGANLVPGITASLLDSAGWNGSIDADYGLFEIDEAALPVVAREVILDAVAVTNLFRDQLDRFGELDTAANLIARGILQNTSRAVLNADDPNVAQLVPETVRIFYGVEGTAAASAAGIVEPGAVSAGAAAGGQMQSGPASAGSPDENLCPVTAGISAAGTTELSNCSRCGEQYSYAVIFYGQLGHYSCRRCGMNRPTPVVSAREVSIGASMSRFVLVYGEEELPVGLDLPGMFNVYNALAASGLAYALGIAPGAVRDGLAAYKTLFGRSERLKVRGKDVLIQLIKNPAGASQAVCAAAGDPSARVLIAVNDNIADGRDVSWLWDADFELLAQHGKVIFISGQRCLDMALRLKYGGFPQDKLKIVSDLRQAVETAVEQTDPGETLWILPTYTCLLELQKIMKAFGYTLSGT